MCNLFLAGKQKTGLNSVVFFVPFLKKYRTGNVMANESRRYWILFHLQLILDPDNRGDTRITNPQRETATPEKIKFMLYPIVSVCNWKKCWEIVI